MVALLEDLLDSGGEPLFLLRVVYGYLYSTVAYGELWIVESWVVEKIASILGFIGIHFTFIASPKAAQKVLDAQQLGFDEDANLRHFLCW